MKLPLRFWVDSGWVLLTCAAVSAVSVSLSGEVIVDVVYTTMGLPQPQVPVNQIVVVAGRICGFCAVMLLVIGMFVLPVEVFGKSLPYKKYPVSFELSQKMWRTILLGIMGVLAWMLVIGLLYVMDVAAQRVQ